MHNDVILSPEFVDGRRISSEWTAPHTREILNRLLAVQDDKEVL